MVGYPVTLSQSTVGQESLGLPFPISSWSFGSSPLPAPSVGGPPVDLLQVPGSEGTLPLVEAPVAEAPHSQSTVGPPMQVAVALQQAPPPKAKGKRRVAVIRTMPKVGKPSRKKAGGAGPSGVGGASVAPVPPEVGHAQAGGSGGSGSGGSSGRVLRQRKAADPLPAPAPKKKKQVRVKIHTQSFGHVDSESEGSEVVRGRRVKPWPVFFPRPRTWARWSVYRSEEAHCWHAHQLREGGDPALVRYTNLVAPDLPRPEGGPPPINRAERIRNPWRWEVPRGGLPPMRQWESPATHEETWEQAVATEARQQEDNGCFVGYIWKRCCRGPPEVFEEKFPEAKEEVAAWWADVRKARGYDSDGPAFQS